MICSGIEGGLYIILKTENEWKILSEELIQRADNIVKEKQHVGKISMCKCQCNYPYLHFVQCNMDSVSVKNIKVMNTLKAVSSRKIFLSVAGASLGQKPEIPWHCGVLVW